jgi:regulator of protease activity HflC (stomatin/prohibitin superfamily)
VSVSVLDANEVGLEWNAVSQTLDDSRLYEAGTYALGPGHSFVKYPRVQTTIKYSREAGDDGEPIPCRTADGLPITVAFGFNYRFVLTARELAARFVDFGDADAVDLAYQRAARNVVRVTASRYLASSFFFDRASIQADLSGRMNAALSEIGGVVETLQLLDVGFPPEFNDARTRQESATQQIAQASNELQVAAINAATRVQRAAQEAALILSRARADADAAVLRNDAAVRSLAVRYAAERASYAALKAALNFTTADLLAYVWLDAAKGRAGDESYALPLPALLRQ